MHFAKRTMSLLLVLVMLCTFATLAFAADADPLTITASGDSVQMKKTIALSVNTDSRVSWQSSDTDVAEVDGSGVVTGVSAGVATITAKAADGRAASLKLFVTRRRMPWRDLLEKQQILGYRYSYKGDYYYTDDKDCWQKFFGFNFAYDWLAPLFLMEYDYVRVFFPYEGKDWMIQMWKGQYGMVFYGSEVGVYTKPEGKESASRFAHYAGADMPDFLKISNALYRKNFTTGDYDLEYERPYDDYWWNAGFVPGHLWDTTPCDELRTVTRITFKDAQMAKLFTDGLTECGFESVKSVGSVKPDTFFRDGADVHLQWQSISQAANSHVVQTAVYGPVALAGFLLMLTVGALLLFSLGGLALLVLI
ncbi:MAG: DUF4474 domain-containing protein [Clostridia bacterium]|nr:DUF4474 domain-containing protein [Clostridia bacterium]